jgi:DNA-binding CsgD family transcriptional regulator
MVINDDHVLALVSRIYESAVEPEHWCGFLHGLKDVLRSGSAVLHLHTKGERQAGRIMAAVGADPSFQAEWDAYDASINIWAVNGTHLLQEGAVLTGEMVWTDDGVRRSEYDNDYLRRFGLCHALAAVPAVEGNTALILALLAPKSRGAFGEDAIALLHELLPHLKRAVRIRSLLESAEFERRAMQRSVEQLPFGLVLLDSANHMVFANRAARAIADAHDGFQLTATGLAAALAHETMALRRLLTSATQVPPASRPGLSLTLSRPSGKRALEVLIAPLGGLGGERFNCARAALALFIVDPTDRPNTSHTVLQHLYGLTPSEARVAAALARGDSVSDVAMQFELTLNSARWMVKQVLHKTDTRSQAQAVALIARGAAILASAP